MLYNTVYALCKCALIELIVLGKDYACPSDQNLQETHKTSHSGLGMSERYLAILYHGGKSGLVLCLQLRRIFNILRIADEVVAKLLL